MADDKILNIRLVGNSKGAVSSLNKVESKSGRLGARLKKFGAMAATGIGAIGIAAGVVVAKSVSLEAAFSKSMNKVQASTGASGKQMKQLQALAIKMGKDTVFSASDAADAMLELAKGGLKPAVIQAGALKSAMNLAAAGDMNMADAANTVVKAMGGFGLKGKQSAQIANALAGAANASAADVSDLTQALAQASAGAHQVGFTIQETTAALAAFSNAGVNGSDAGTSLKTMLQRLQPQTKKVKDGMRDVGLYTNKTGSAFVNADGTFKSLAQISGLLHDKLGGLTKAQQQQALTTIFGSDASRAATILMNEGAKGIKKYEKATSNQTAAQKMAQAGMKGTAGALEQLKGSIETVQLQFGLLIKPYVNKALKLATSLVNGLGDMLGKVAPKIKAFFSGLSGGGKASGQFKKTFGAIKKFAMDLWPTLKKIGTGIIDAIGPGLKQIGELVQNKLMPAIRKILPVVEPVAKVLLSIFGGAVIGVIKGFIQAIKGVVQIVSGVFSLISDLIHGNWNAAWHDLLDIAKGVLNLVLGALKVWWNAGILSIFKRGALMLTKGIWVKLFEALKGLAKKGVKGIEVALKKVAEVLLSPFRRGFNAVRGFVKEGWNYVRSRFLDGVSIVKQIVSRIYEVWSYPYRKAYEFLRSIVPKAWNFVRDRFSAGVRAVGSIVGRVRGIIGNAFRNVGSWLWNAGSSLIDGLLRGIVSKFEDVKRKLSELTHNIVGWKGPPARDKVLLTPAGESIMDGFTKGLVSRFGDVKGRLKGFTRGLAGVASQGLSGASMGPLPLAAGGGNVYIDVTIDGNVIGERDLAKRIAPTIREEFINVGRRNGGRIFPQ